MAADNRVQIDTVVNASGVGPGVDQTVVGLKKVETGATTAATAATGLGDAAKQAGDGAAQLGKQAGEAGQTGVAPLGELSATAKTNLATFGITLDQVKQSAAVAGASLENTARVMIAMKKTELADELDRIREKLEAAAEAANATGESVDELGQAHGELATETNNASAASGDLNDTLEATSAQMEGNKKSAHGFLEELGGARESRRIAIELFETMQGGGTTIEGLTGLMRTFLLTTDALAPELAVLAGVGLALGGLLAAHWDKTKQAAIDNTTEVRNWKDAVTDFETYLKSLDEGQFWVDRVKQAQEYTKELDAQIARIKMIQAAEDAVKSSKLALREAELDNEEQGALTGKSGPEAERIKAYYALAKAQARNQFDEDKAKTEVERIQAEMTATAKKQNIKADAVSGSESDLADARRIRDFYLNQLPKLGIDTKPTQQDFRGPLAQQLPSEELTSRELDRQLKELEEQRDKDIKEGKDVEGDTTRINFLQRKITALKLYLEAKKQVDEIEKRTGAAIRDASEGLDDAQAKLEALRDQLQAAQNAAGTAFEKKGTALEEFGNKDDAIDAKANKQDATKAAKQEKQDARAEAKDTAAQIAETKGAIENLGLKKASTDMRRVVNEHLSQGAELIELIKVLHDNQQNQQQQINDLKVTVKVHSLR